MRDSCIDGSRRGAGWCAAFGSLVCAVLCGGAAGLDVPLQVAETAGVARSADPCRTGVPLAPGAVTDETKLRVVDEKGNEVAAQFRVINRRPAGDVEWVCVDFPADVPANGKAVYHLTDGGPGKAIEKPVKVEDGADSVTVLNGPLKLVVPKKTLAGLGEVWVDRDGDGKFAADELVSKGGALVIEGMDGKVYRSTTDLTAPVKVTVEEQSPLFVAVRIDGEMKAQSADGKSHTYPFWAADGAKRLDDVKIQNADRTIGFTVRVQVWKGETWVRTFVTMRVLSGETRGWYNSHWEQNDKIQFGTYFAESAQRPGNFLVDAVNWDVDLAFAPLDYRIGGGVQGDRVHSGKMAADAPGVTLYQDTPADWFWQGYTGQVYDPLLKENAAWLKQHGIDKPFREEFAAATHPAGETWGKRLLIDRDGHRFMGYRLYENAPTGRPGDATSAEDLGKPSGEGMRAPGWVEVADGRTAVTAGCRWFWQMCPKSIGIRPGGRITFGLWPREFSRGHLFEGRVHRTHEMVFDFRAAGKGLEAGRRFAAFDRRLIAWPGAGQNLASRAYGDFPLYPMEGWPRYEKSALSAVACASDAETPPGSASCIEVEREKYDHYGVWKFGGCVEVAWHQFSQYLEWDALYCLMVQFARTGDYRFFREAEILTSLLLDVSAYGGGYGHPGANPFHYYALGPTLVSNVSADARLREAVIHSYGLAMPDPAKPAEGHAAANPGFTKPEPRRLDVTACILGANLDIYLHFPEDRARYGDGLKAALARWRAVAPDVQGTDKAFKFTFSMGADAAGRYCEIFPDDKDSREALVKACRAWKDNFEKTPADPGDKMAERMSMANGFAYAARFSGDAALLDFAAGKLAPDKDFSTNYRTGSSSAKTWTQFGHRFTQVFLHDWDKKQHPEKYKDLP